MIVSSELLERTVMAIEIILAGVTLYFLYQAVLRHRLLSRKLVADFETIRSGAFVLVYFTTPGCFLCNTIQRPAIEKLRILLEDHLEVLEIDITTHPELAQRWGVRSAPTTFLISPRGEMLHVNHGAVHAEQLLFQLYIR